MFQWRYLRANSGADAPAEPTTFFSQAHSVAHVSADKFSIVAPEPTAHTAAHVSADSPPHPWPHSPYSHSFAVANANADSYFNSNIEALCYNSAVTGSFINECAFLATLVGTESETKLPSDSPSDSG